MPDTPNILFLLTDQLRLDAVSCYTDTPCRTPSLDSLAEDGVRFENAYCPCPVCTPSRASVLTGEFPHNHGMTQNAGNEGCSIHAVPNRPDLLPRRLDDAGYDLGYTGKWHLCPASDDVFGVDVPQRVPSDLGFRGHDIPGHGDGGWETDPYRAYLDDQGYTLEFDILEGCPGGRAGVVEAPTSATVPAYLADHTISLLEEFQDRDSPFCLLHNFWGPHEPYYPSREFYDRYADVEIPPWPNADWPAGDIPGVHHNRLSERAQTAAWEEWAEVVRHYYAFTAMIDSQIGRILEYLETSGLATETLVVFAADHGETLGSHGGLVDKGFHHFEEIMNVPLIIRFPDGQWKNTTRSELVSLLDLYPTFLDAASIDTDATDQYGQSLYTLLEDDGTEWRDAVGMEFHGLGGISHSQRTIRTNDLKYGYNPGLRDELYDLSLDPDETQNLVDNPAYETELEEMRDHLRAWQTETDDSLPSPGDTIY